MTDEKNINLRVFCLCGQKMKIKPDMYGRPAKCVACHQKWFVPNKEEIPGDAARLYLKDHPELLRQPGQIARSTDERPVMLGAANEPRQPAPPPIPMVEVTAPQNAHADDEKGKNAQPIPPVREEELPESVQDGKSVDVARCEPAIVLHKTQKIPLEPLEPMRLLCSYREELNKRREAAEAADKDVHQTLFASYERSLQRTLEKLLQRLETEQKSTARQLAGIEDEIARRNIALRVGDCALETFMAQTADLRRSREALVRHNHNLLAWQEMDEPCMAGGMAEVVLESFDEASFEIHIPTPVLTESDKPLFVVYGDELRDSLRMRSALERRKAEWVRIAEDQGFPANAVKEGIAETEAALARNMALVCFCRARMEQLLLDCDNDLKALSAYKNDVLERAGKGQMRENSRRETLDQIQTLEENTIRTRSLIRQALSANSPVEVPAATDTLVQRLRGTMSENALAVDTLFFGAAVALIAAGLLMFAEAGRGGADWLAVLSVCAAIAVTASGIMLEKNIRGPVIGVLWIALIGLLTIFLYQRTAMDAYLIGLTQQENLQIPTINVRAWLLLSGAVCSGLGTGFALNEYLGRTAEKQAAGATLVVFCALISGTVIAVTHTLAPRAMALDIQYDMPTTHTDEHQHIVSPIAPIPDTRRVEAQKQYEQPQDASVTEDTGERITPLGAVIEQEATPEDMMPFEAEEADLAKYMIMFAMHGVVHGEGTEPRFRASLSFPDGRVENMALRLGDAIFGEWEAKEYNRYTKKLTISNGERLLILQAGDRVPIQPSETGQS